MYYFGSGSTEPAVTRKIIESELIEQHHWLPQDIAEIPYKRLQEHFLIVKQKNVVTQSKANIQKAKQQNINRNGGQMKSFVREI